MGAPQKKAPGGSSRARRRSPCHMELDPTVSVAVQFACLEYGSKSCYGAILELAEAWPYLKTQLDEVSDVIPRLNFGVLF